jgi:hypothetical protein
MTIEIINNYNIKYIMKQIINTQHLIYYNKSNITNIINELNNNNLIVNISSDKYWNTIFYEILFTNNYIYILCLEDDFLNKILLKLELEKQLNNKNEVKYNGKSKI